MYANEIKLTIFVKMSAKSILKHLEENKYLVFLIFSMEYNSNLTNFNK